MERFVGRHKGDLSLTNDLEIMGLVNGSVTVPAGKFLRLRGRITGDLIIQSQGLAAIHGTVAGTVVNHGADVEILGKVGD